MGLHIKILPVVTDEWQEEKQGREDVGSAHDTRNLNSKNVQQNKLKI
jgi:hypothetical protein